MTRHRFVPDQHDAVVLRDDLQWLADAWTDLLDRLGRDQAPPDGQPKPKTPAVGLVINERVSELMRALTRYTWAAVNVLVLETADFRLPRDHSTPSLLLAVAGRVGHFTAHEDRETRDRVVDGAADLRRKVRRAAYPDGVRTIHLDAYRCMERVLDDDGRHVSCAGHWTIRPHPAGALGDMVCSWDADHRVEPYRWMRVVRRRGRLDETADQLVRLIGA